MPGGTKRFPSQATRILQKQGKGQAGVAARLAAPDTGAAKRELPAGQACKIDILWTFDAKRGTRIRDAQSEE